MILGKIKLLFDGNIISNGALKNSSRTGIYFCAINLLKEFIKNPETDVILYCEKNNFANLNVVLQENFDRKFKIFTNELYNTRVNFYKAIKSFRKQAKNNKEYIFSFILQIIMYIFALDYHFEKILFNIKRFFILKNINTYFSPAFAPPKFIQKRKYIKKYVLLHDVIPIVLKEYYPNEGWFREMYNYLNAEDTYFANSDYTMFDFLKYNKKINKNKIYSTLLGRNNLFNPTVNNFDEIRKKYNIPKNSKYVFSLCTLEPRKNLIRTVKSFVDFIKKHNIEDLVFVLGGSHWDMFIGKLKKEIFSLDEYKDKIIRAGYIDDEDLPCLYSNAQWFVYTSQYEGFGLPPLEAMSCACPVITSNNTSLPEVVGDAGIMIDWDSDEQHVEAYEKYYFDENYRKEMAQKGLERSKQFSWEKCANKMINIMKNNL